MLLFLMQMASRLQQIATADDADEASCNGITNHGQSLQVAGRPDAT